MIESRPLVYVVLLNYRGWRDTTDCLESVFRSTYANFRVIVCDNGSPDDSRERMEAWARGALLAGDRIDAASPLRSLVWPPVPKPLEYIVLRGADVTEHAAGAGDRLTFIHIGANLGFSGGNNAGVRYALAAGADYVMLLNNDTLLAPTAIEALVARAQRDPRAGVVGGKLLELLEPERVQAAAGGTFRRWHGMVRMSQSGAGRHETRDDAPLDYVSGAFMLTPAAALREVGLLDDRFFIYAEDQDYGVRMKRAGWKLVYEPAAELWHRGGATEVHGSPTFDYHSVHSMLHLVRKHDPPLVPVAVLYSIYHCVLPKIVRGQWRRLTATGRAYRDFARDARG